MWERGDVPHNRVCDGHNGTVGAVVRGELKVGDIREALVEVQNVVDAGATPRVDVLGVIADNRNSCVDWIAVKSPNEVVLGIIDILELVDENPAKGSGPGAAGGSREPIQCLQRELIDMVDVSKGFGALVAEDLLAERVKGSTENPAGAHEILETGAHHGGGVMGKCQKNNLFGPGPRAIGIREEPGDAGRERCCFAGTGRGQNAEVLGRRLANDRGLFVIESDGAFGECEGCAGAGHSKSERGAV